MSGKPELKIFDPEQTCLQEYQDEDYQPIYFVSQSFDAAKELIRFVILTLICLTILRSQLIAHVYICVRKSREYSKKIKRPYQVHYDPYTQSIKVVDNMTVIQEIKRTIEHDTELLLNSLEHFNNIKIK